jgi:hypothetical protein
MTTSISFSLSLRLICLFWNLTYWNFWFTGHSLFAYGSLLKTHWNFILFFMEVVKKNFHYICRLAYVTSALIICSKIREVESGNDEAVMAEKARHWYLWKEEITLYNVLVFISLRDIEWRISSIPKFQKITLISICLVSISFKDPS